MRSVLWISVFNTEQMHQAVLAFRRYEDASLRYTGIDSHEGLTCYGLYDTWWRRNTEAREDTEAHSWPHASACEVALSGPARWDALGCVLWMP